MSSLDNPLLYLYNNNKWLVWRWTSAQPSPRQALSANHPLEWSPNPSFLKVSGHIKKRTCSVDRERNASSATPSIFGDMMWPHSGYSKRSGKTNNNFASIQWHSKENRSAGFWAKLFGRCGNWKKNTIAWTNNLHNMDCWWWNQYILRSTKSPNGEKPFVLSFSMSLDWPLYTSSKAALQSLSHKADRMPSLLIAVTTLLQLAELSMDTPKRQSRSTSQEIFLAIPSKTHSIRKESHSILVSSKRKEDAKFLSLCASTKNWPLSRLTLQYKTMLKCKQLMSF